MSDETEAAIQAVLDLYLTGTGMESIHPAKFGAAMFLAGLKAGQATHSHGMVCKPEESLRCGVCGQTYFVCKVCHADVYGHHEKCPGQ